MLFTIIQYLNYYRKSITKYKVHSPFVFTFIAEILEKKISKNKRKAIKKLKKSYRVNEVFIPSEDYGAGSVTCNTTNNISTKTILHHVSIKKKYGKILNNIVNFYKCEICIELGTSLGISTSYLSNGFNNVTSIEGNKVLATIARERLNNQGFVNIDIIHSKFDEVFENILKKNKTFDLLFIDGNHTEEATIKYFKTALKYKNKDSIIIFDDIYWSVGMKNAWNTIKKDENIYLSIDLFQFGIIFFNSDFMKKEHFTLWY